MNTADYAKKDRAHVWHPYTRRSTTEAFPLPLITHAEGLYLFDSEGNRYLDAISSWWSCSLGHGNPAVVEAIQKQTAELQHSILGNLSHPRAVELATQLAALMPNPKRHVMFASDGSSAVEAALKMAVQYQHNLGRIERTRFAYLQDAYHGDTLGTVSVGYQESFHKPFRHILFPSYVLPVPEKTDSEPACLRKAESILARHANELAGLVVEPLCQGAAGMKMYPASYLTHLAGLCAEHDVPMIVDEIATGFGRTGRMFAFEHAGIDPDIVCVGKALSGGTLPISAAIVKDALYDTFSDQPEDHTFYHGHTFCGNPIAAAAALAALRVYDAIDVCKQARAMESCFRKHLAPLAAISSVKDVRFLGGIAAVEFEEEGTPETTDATAKEVAIGRTQQVQALLLQQQILVRPLGRVVYLMPPLIIESQVLSTLLDAFSEAVRRTRNSP